MFGLGVGLGIGHSLTMHFKKVSDPSRLLETGGKRILEDGSFRLLE